MSLIKDSKHLEIPFKDIQAATKNFTTLIGRGGYGFVYQGKLSVAGEIMTVAVKRLQRDFGQGIKEFLTEIQLLSRYKHPNLVSLVGYCEEPYEKFLIYEYAGHGSLDSYLKVETRCPLTWKQRINICIDAARGLDHLHSHVAQDHRVIHRDIKSANILLDHNWKAMIADFGLSKIGRANENESYLITNAVGTNGYCDPEYIRTGIVTKESDVYSFGVVLFEVLCGRLCYIHVNNDKLLLAPLARRYYKEEKLNLIIDSDLKNYMNSDSMKHFSGIAFQCLHGVRDLRPPIGLVLQILEKALKSLEIEEAPELLELEEALELHILVETLQMEQFKDACEMQEVEETLGLHELVETLQMQQYEEACEIKELEETLGLPNLVETLQRHEFEEALKLQEEREMQKLLEILKLETGGSGIDYEVIKAIYDLPNTPLSYITIDKVYSHLSSGILVDEGKVWFSINDDGKTQEIMSAMKILPLTGDRYTIRPDYESRFSEIAVVSLPFFDLQVKIRTNFLSSDVTYAAYLVCKPYSGLGQLHIEQNDVHSLVYTLNGTNESYISNPRKMDDHGWWMFELFQVTSCRRIVDIEVTFRKLNSPFVDGSYLLLEGIHFLPIEKFGDKDEIENAELNNPSTSNTEWDNRLPSDYKSFLYYSNKKMRKKPQRDVIFPPKEQAYSTLLRGVLIKVNYDIKMWFWITKLNGKKCFMLPPSLLSYDNRLVKLKRRRSKDSRIEEVLDLLPAKVVGMHLRVPNGLLSTNTTYACYLVYKTAQVNTFDLRTTVTMRLDDGSVILTHLNMPLSPVIGPDGVCRSLSPINNLKTIQLPRKRKDDWMEVNLGTKSDIQWMNMQQDKQFDLFWGRESTRKSCFLLCILDNESDDKADNDTSGSFILDPPHFSNMTVYMSRPFHDRLTQKLIVQGIEFRPV